MTSAKIGSKSLRNIAFHETLNGQIVYENLALIDNKLSTDMHITRRYISNISLRKLFQIALCIFFYSHISNTYFIWNSFLQTRSFSTLNSSCKFMNR